MSVFRVGEKRQALLFITLGLVMTIFSYQNFQYPEHLKKSSIDVDASLNASAIELQRTRSRLGADSELRLRAPMPNLASAKTQVIESNAPMRLKLKRAPAKSSQIKKTAKKKSSSKSTKQQSTQKKSSKKKKKRSS